MNLAHLFYPIQFIGIKFKFKFSNFLKLIQTENSYF